MLWSVGDTKPSTPLATDIVPHSNQARGSIALNFLGGQQKIILDDTSEISFPISAKVRQTFDYTVRYVIIHDCE